MNKLSLCNAALIKIGASTITDFTSTSVESFTAQSIYDLIKDALLSAHSWGFATRTARLIEINDNNNNTPPNIIKYQLPENFLRALNTFTDNFNNTANYEIRDTQIISSQKNLWLKYIATIDEENLPPYFNQVLVARLAAEFCLPITDSTSRMESLHRIALSELQKAKGIDSQQEPPQILSDNSLIGARS